MSYGRKRQAWLETFKPFGARPSPPHAPTSELDAALEEPPPEAADYDLYHRTRYIDPEAPPTPKDSLEAMREMYRRNRYTLDDLTPYRIRVAYRLVKALGVALKCVREDESLSDATSIPTYADSECLHPINPWYARHTLPKSITPRALAAAESLDDAEGDRRHVAALKAAAKLSANPNTREDVTLSLLPPVPPRRWMKEGVPHPAYDPSNPAHDKDLVLYVGTLRAFYHNFAMNSGSPNYPHYGTYGYLGLDQTWTIRQAFPTSNELLAFESILITDTVEQLRDSGTLDTRRWLKAEYGFTDKECSWAIDMTRNAITKMVSTDVDQQRFMDILRLEDTIRRARSSMDLRNEIAGIKQLAQEIGVTRTEPNDYNSEAASILKEFEAQGKGQSPSQLNSPGVKSVPSEVLQTLPPPGQTPPPPV